MSLAAFGNIGTLLSTADSPMFATEEAKKALIGLARDLRGLAYAFNTKTSYMMLFDWMYPFIFLTPLTRLLTNIYIMIFLKEKLYLGVKIVINSAFSRSFKVKWYYVTDLDTFLMVLLYIISNR